MLILPPGGVREGRDGIPKLAERVGDSLEDARKALAALILTWKMTRNYKGKIRVVFDGRDGIYNRDDTICGINCIYTGSKQEADDRIISMVRNSPDAANITVISNDNYVSNNCRSHGATVKPPGFLLQPPGKKGNKGKKPKEKRGKKLSMPQPRTG